jgi:hypothetical protein
VINYSSRKLVFRQIYAPIDSSRKTAPEEVMVTLSAIRFISSQPRSQADYADLLFLIKELCAHYEKAKKTSIRITIIRSLERIVQPIDMTSVDAVEPSQIAMYVWLLISCRLNELHDLRRKASKWARDDDLRSSCLRLMGVILMNSKLDYFSENIDAYITHDLLPKPKVKPYIYESVLQLLRGRFYPESLVNIRKRIMGKYVVTDCYTPQALTRPAYEEGQDVIESRLTTLASRLFINRANNFGPDVINTCVQIIVQMAVQRYWCFFNR